MGRTAEFTAGHSGSYRQTGVWKVPPSTLPNGDRVEEYGDAVGRAYQNSWRSFHPVTGEETGRLDVISEYPDPEHTVQWMHVPEHLRGRGTMTQLLEHHVQHNMRPEETLRFSHFTDDGSAWASRRGLR